MAPNIFKQMKDFIDGLERAERVTVNDETKAERVQRTRHERRERQLNTLVPDRRCPLCGRIRLRSKQWVIRDGSACCLSCSRRA